MQTDPYIHTQNLKKSVKEIQDEETHTWAQTLGDNTVAPWIDNSTHTHTHEDFMTKYDWLLKISIMHF